MARISDIMSDLVSEVGVTSSQLGCTFLAQQRQLLLGWVGS
jgi:hypothetical protein